MASISNVRYPWPSSINVANFISTRLWFNDTSTNYQAWREQMLCLIDGQDLLGFIDGSISRPEAEDVGHDHYALWRRSDRLLKGWILGSVDENLVSEVAGLETARDVWYELENKFRRLSDKLRLRFQTDRSVSASIEQNNQEKDLIEYMPLHKAALQGDWEAAKRIFDQNPDAIGAPLNYDNLTPLQIAVGTGKSIHFVQKMVEIMSDEAIVERNNVGNTALHYAAAVGNISAASILVNRMPRLLYVSNFINDDFPVRMAALYGHRKMLQYLISVTKEQTPYEGVAGLRLLLSLIDAEFFDLALYLVENYSYLAKLRSSNGQSALSTIAANRSAFTGGGRLSFLERFIPNCCRGLNSRMEKHITNQQAKKLAKCLCNQLESTMSFKQASEISRDAITTAAHFGNNVFLEMIIEAFPNAIHIVTTESGSRQSIFHVAVQSRAEYVYNLIYQMSDHKYLYTDVPDDCGNNLLHIAGKLAPPHKLNRICGAALQMQRELQWYKEVEKVVHPNSRKRLNDDGKSPSMIFTEEHRKLKEEGEKWMKDTSTSCTIAATLIATVIFAAAITVPGGNESTTGFPIFSKDIVFIVFAISDAASLFMSTTSLLMFLSILTSRYSEEDFLHVLPKRLIIGLTTLFLSITFMMVAFSATIYLVFGEKKAWVLIPVIALACLPVTSFVYLQFPLLLELISSTYGSGIFGKQSDRPFY